MADSGSESHFAHLGRLSETGVGAISALYVCGYYINALYLARLGVSPADAFKSRYVFVGFTFALYVALVVLPVWFLRDSLRRASRTRASLLGAFLWCTLLSAAGAVSLLGV